MAIRNQNIIIIVILSTSSCSWRNPNGGSFLFSQLIKNLLCVDFRWHGYLDNSRFSSFPFWVVPLFYFWLTSTCSPFINRQTASLFVVFSCCLRLSGFSSNSLCIGKQGLVQLAYSRKGDKNGMRNLFTFSPLHPFLFVCISFLSLNHHRVCVYCVELPTCSLTTNAGA